MLGIKDRLSLLLYRWQSIPLAVKTIALACAAVFIVQSVSDYILIIGRPYYISASAVIERVFGLFWPIASAGAFWQPLTYIFLHGSWMHLLMNMIGLLSFGTAVEYMLGSRRLWLIFLLSGIVGGVFWMVFDCYEPKLWEYCASLPYEWCQTLAQKWAEEQVEGIISHTCVGASGGVFGLIGAFTALFPKHRIVFLLFFVIPVRMQTRYMAILLVLGTLVGICWNYGNVAHVAHLFGGLTGYICARIVRVKTPAF